MVVLPLTKFLKLFLGYLQTFDTVFEATTRNMLSNIGPNIYIIVTHQIIFNSMKYIMEL